MPARKRPTPEDAVAARRILLDGLAQDARITGLAGELAHLHPRGNTFPGEMFLRLAADTLHWCGASRAGPLALEGIRERFLPECAFRGHQNRKLRFAVLAAAALHGETEPDLLDEVAWPTGHPAEAEATAEGRPMWAAATLMRAAVAELVPGRRQLGVKLTAAEV